MQWKPFQLAPNLGPEGADKMEHYLRKFGPQAERMLKDPNNMLNRRAQEMMALSEAKDDPRPIGFKYHEGARVFNTLRCHMLAESVANDVEKQNLLQEIMFRKYFLEGKDLNQDAELHAIGKEAGLTEEFVDAAIGDKSPLRESVTRELMGNMRRGISGVPFVIFHPTREQASGGLPPEEFAEFLERCAAPS